MIKINVYHPINSVTDVAREGSGTILIEGAMEAFNIAPGINRKFAAEDFTWMDSKIWAEERARAKSLIDFDCPFEAYGSDIDPEAIRLAKANAKRAGVLDRIDFRVADIRDFKKHSDRGTVICNPPYGERLLDVRQAEELYKVMGNIFNREKGWFYGIISPDEQFENLFGRKSDKRRKLYNGMIKCQYYMYFK